MFYYQKVLARDPSAADFYRQFYSPGVGHCSGGTGVLPTNALYHSRAWVENGTAPDVLHAASPYPVKAPSSLPVNVSDNVRFLDLCPWPAVEIYHGQGDLALAEPWDCVGGTSWTSFLGVKLEGRFSLVGGPN
jgi:feruloyl esterase